MRPWLAHKPSSSGSKVSSFRCYKGPYRTFCQARPRDWTFVLFLDIVGKGGKAIGTTAFGSSSYH